MRTRICNGIVVDGNGMKPHDILIEDGHVAALLERQDPTGDATIFDASGCYVFPGFIDAHNHPVYADAMDTFSRAALAGGVTTIIPYIGAVAAWGKQGGLAENLDTFIAESERDGVVDFGLHCTITENVFQEADVLVPELIRRGIISFKGFTSYRRRGMMLSDPQILHFMDLVADGGGLLAFHAENDALLEYMENRAKAVGHTHPRFYPGTHPNLSEAEAVFRVLALGAEAGCDLYLPHLTCAQSLAVVEMFRSWNCLSTLYTETCPHYLTLTADTTMERFGNLAKMSPPLREQEDVEALWDALAAGRIDVVASDAAASDRAANSPLFDDTFRAPNGIPGVESLVPVFWDAAISKGRLPVSTVARLLCENPARIFGLYPRKGTLLPGSDADITIIDPGLPCCIPDKNPYLNIDYSVFAGRSCLGCASAVFRAGRLVAEKGRLKDDLPLGHFLPGKR